MKICAQVHRLKCHFLVWLSHLIAKKEIKGKA